ncbi:hypothetical protein IRB23SM22_08660 [Alkalibacterium sp. s-m-22]
MCEFKIIHSSVHFLDRSKKKPRSADLDITKVITFYFTASFNALPALNAGTLLAGIWISSPV